MPEPDRPRDCEQLVLPVRPLWPRPWEGGQDIDLRVRRPTGRSRATAVGDDGKEVDMSTLSRASGVVSVPLANIMVVAALGAALVFVAGLAQSETLHDAAHDVRHSTGFPCH